MVLFNGTLNFCQSSKKISELAKIVMSLSGLKCSMSEVCINRFFVIHNSCNFIFQGSFCNKDLKVLTLTTLKRMLKMIPKKDPILVRHVVKHDTGTSCFEAELVLKR